jgi:hypothetical protein
MLCVTASYPHRSGVMLLVWYPRSPRSDPAPLSINPNATIARTVLVLQFVFDAENRQQAPLI